MLNLPQLSLSPTLLHFTPLSTTFPPFPAYLSLQTPRRHKKTTERSPRRKGVANGLRVDYLKSSLVEIYSWGRSHRSSMRSIKERRAPVFLELPPLRDLEVAAGP